MSATHLNDNNFDQGVSAGGAPVLIDFWAPWCGPCRAMSGVVDEVASELAGRVQVVKANVDEANEAAARFDVTSIPAFVVVKDGEVKERVSGVVSKQKLLDLLEPHLN